jgi:hypothetical protein
MSIRIIYDYNLTKLKIQYDMIKNFFPEHELYIYNYNNFNQENITHKKYNIYLDTINESEYENLKCDYTILFVNEEYINKKYQKYLRREYFIDKPLIKKKIDYYFCLTKYCYNILINKNINKNKIIYFKNILKTIILKTTILNTIKKYILFDIDIYSYKKNIILLEIWLKYYISTEYNLIIYISHKYDKIVKLFSDLIKKKISFRTKETYYYKNIIITNDLDHLLKYDFKIVILNLSKFSIITKIYNYIIKDKIIIINKNKISREIIKDDNLLFKNFDEIKINIDYAIKLDNNKKYYFNINKINNILKNFNFIKTEFKTNITEIINESKYLDKQSIINSHENIKSLIIKIDKKTQQLKKLNVDKFYRFLKNTNNKTDFCYATIIYINNSYLPSILVNGFKLKSITKLNIVCFVQDKPYYENNILKFPGLNKDDIEQIKKVFDVVIGIDIITNNLNNFNKSFDTNDISKRINYKNIFYYCTKIVCHSFIYYKKLFYYDASVLINQDLIDIFKNNKSSFLNISNLYKNGLHGACNFIIPKSYYIFKFFNLLENYNQIFIKSNFVSPCTIDEVMVYYTIFPNWGNNLDYSLISDNYYRKSYYDLYNDNITYPIEIFAVTKPFRYSLDINQYERNLFNLNNTCYYSWDNVVQLLIEKFPEFKKYFRYIKTCRYCLFKFNKKN